MIPPFSIIYKDLIVYNGDRLQDWYNAPPGIQVVIVWEWDGYKGWTDMPHDRTVYTGEEEYDPFNTGRPKEGKLISDEEYKACWELAKQLEAYS